MADGGAGESALMMYVLPALIGGVGSAMNGNNLESFSGTGSSDPVNSLQTSLAGIKSLTDQLSSRTFSLPGATVPDVKGYSGGGLPMDIGQPMHDPALINPSLLSIEGIGGHGPLDSLFASMAGSSGRSTPVTPPDASGRNNLGGAAPGIGNGGRSGITRPGLGAGLPDPNLNGSPSLGDPVGPGMNDYRNPGPKIPGLPAHLPGPDYGTKPPSDGFANFFGPNPGGVGYGTGVGPTSGSQESWDMIPGRRKAR